MSSLPLLNGSCLCGAIRYRVNAMPFDADLCHCSQCQKSTGSVVGAWMDFKRKQVNWLNQQPKEYASSEHVRRGFCQHCGTQISFRDLRYPDYITLSITSLDDPNLISPNYHIYTDSQLKWLTIADECPKYRAGRS